MLFQGKTKIFFISLIVIIVVLAIIIISLISSQNNGEDYQEDETPTEAPSETEDRQTDAEASDESTQKATEPIYEDTENTDGGSMAEDSSEETLPKTEEYETAESEPEEYETAESEPEEYETAESETDYIETEGSTTEETDDPVTEDDTNTTTETTEEYESKSEESTELESETEEPIPEWDGSIADSFAGGSGTASDPYQIENGSQLAYLADFIKYGDEIINTDETYYVLTADINLANKEWTPIGIGVDLSGSFDGKYTFKGHFDGQNFKIVNVSISQPYRTYYDYLGLFGYNKGTISNLVIDGFNYQLSERYEVVGGLCGASTGSLLNVTVNGVINATNIGYAGGLCGVSSGSLLNVTVNGAINATKIGYTGGLVGHIGESSVIDSAESNVSITVSTTYLLGGIVGDSYGTVINSKASGEIKVSDAVGSFIGGAVGDNKGTVSNSQVNVKLYVDVSGTTGVYVGGFVGNNKGTISYSSQDGYVSVGNACHAKTGGFVGSHLGQIFNCYSLGDVYVYGKASQRNARNGAGGFAGYMSNSEIHRCYFAGDISASADYRADYSSFARTWLDNGDSYELTSCIVFGSINNQREECFIIYSSGETKDENGRSDYTSKNYAWFYPEQLSNPDFYVDEMKWLYGWDYSDLDIENDKYPRIDYESIPNDYVIEIREPSDFLAVHCSEFDVVLKNDIDMSGYSWNAIDFDGNLNGNGYKIVNLDGQFLNKLTGTIKNIVFTRFTDKSNEYSPYFYVVQQNEGTVENCILIADTIAGCFAYTNRGSIKECESQISVIGYSDDVVGIARENSGEFGIIEKCEVTIKINTLDGDDCVGIAMSNDGKIINCMSSIEIENAEQGSIPAGLVFNNSGLLENCFSILHVNINTDGRTEVDVTAGGICINNFGDINNCYGVSNLECVTQSTIPDYKSGSVNTDIGGICVRNNGSISNSYTKTDIMSYVTINGKKYSRLSINTQIGYIVSENSGTIENTYYDKNSTLYATEKDNEVKVGNEYGEGMDEIPFGTESFIFQTLGWSSDVWEIPSGAMHPQFK